VRIEFLVGKDDRRLARKIVKRLPGGAVRIGEPGRIENAQGQFIGWVIAHPALDEIDAIRLKYVMDTMAEADEVFTNHDLDDDGKLTATEVRALRDRIDAVPAVDTAIKAYRRAQRGAG
jgi:hypothetical protein